MFLDSLSHHAKYIEWLPRTKRGFEFLLEDAKASLSEGRHEIDGDQVFAICSKYTTVDPRSKEPEAHRKYLDIQYMISGRETVLWTPLDETGPETAPYDAERDITFYTRNARCRAIELAAGHFAIFLPTDAHEPGCNFGPPAPVHKVVVKVLV